MIKGINRQVVEIKDTGSAFFERILVIIRPEYSDIPRETLEQETKRVIKNILPQSRRKKTKRKRKKSCGTFDPFNTMGILKH